MATKQRRSGRHTAEIGTICRLASRPTLVVAAALIVVSCALTIGWGRGLPDSTAEVTTVTLAMQLSLVLMPIASVITSVGSILLAVGVVLVILARACDAAAPGGVTRSCDDEAAVERLDVG